MNKQKKFQSSSSSFSLITDDGQKQLSENTKIYMKILRKKMIVFTSVKTVTRAEEGVILFTRKAQPKF